ncbi:MAG: hypothetical protein C4293_20515 [Nitrospiraceae bacterium]
MSESKFLSSLFLILALLGAATPSFAEAPLTKQASAEESTTTITSQRMTVRNQENKAIFEGAVVLTRGPLVVHSDVMVVFFQPADQSSPSGNSQEILNGKPKETATAERGRLPIMANRSVRMIEATGRVKIIKADGQATCRKAIYHGSEDKIVLTGDPVAWQKGTRVSGQKITMYLAEDRSVVEGESRVMIEPEGGGTH